MTSTAVRTERVASAPATTRRRPGLGAALRWELRKLRSQLRTRAVLAGSVVLPIAVVVIMRSQSRPPKDTLFGRFAIDNGFAMALLILGFAAQWVLPLVTSVVTGDIFASEDQHGTWKTVLTRSTSRSTLFWAKTVAATLFTIVALLVLAVSTIAASLLLVGHDPLTGLSGQTIAGGTAFQLIVASWASVLLPMLGFTCLALLFSVWSSNAAVGIAAPVVLGLVMQLVGALGGVESLRPYLLSTPFEAWHGFFSDPLFTGPLLSGAVTSAGWSVVCLVATFLILRRRNITGG
jgi:ABC-2 type transport system permease protein